MTAKPPEIFALDRLRTPIGVALLVTDAEGALRALDWEDYEPRMRQLLRLHYGAPVLQSARAPDDHPLGACRHISPASSRARTIKWRVAGTAFQRDVWTALRTIPAGTTTSYGALAAQLGKAQAVRAVGLANGANPISVVVPCHRVIGANGSLTGYGGGLRAQAMAAASTKAWRSSRQPRG